MTRLLLILLSIVAATACSAQPTGARYLTADTLQRPLSLSSWVCQAGDNPKWAAPELNDSGWTYSSTAKIDLAADTPIHFEGIAWFRKHIRIDSTLVGVSLTLEMSHSGASQIFLDGDSLTTFGVLTPSDGARYYDPQGKLMPFVFREAGDHIVAVRYAKWDARALSKRWGEHVTGFTLVVDHAEAAIARHRHNMLLNVGLILSLVILFGTLGFIHLILWLYYRAARSNLPFAIFSLSLSALFYFLLVRDTANSPSKIAFTGRLSPYVMLVSMLALSAFINTLFSRRKWRFRLIAGLGILSALLIAVPYEVAAAGELPELLFVIVLLETVVLTMWAIFKKRPGARIIGAGVLLFSLFVLVIVAVGAVSGGIFLNLNPNENPVMFALAAASILAIPISMSVYLAWNFANVNKRLEAELLQVEALSEQSRVQEEERQRLLETRQEELEREVATRTEQLRGEKQKSDTLLLNILPEEVAEELKEKGYAQARLHDDVTVLFTDFVDFTQYSEKLAPAEIVDELDGCFKAFDEIITRHGLEKIKTIGDAYMAVAGLPVPHPDGAASTVAAALEIREYIRCRRSQQPDSFDIRIGVHSGPVVAGIIGVKKFAYDIWGDTVNTAARMEQGSESGKVNINGATYALVKDRFACTYRGEVAAKGKGAMGMYFVERKISQVPNVVG
jgi:class 3 adenylate cyclase